MRRTRQGFLVAMAVFVAHGVIQFFSWSAADSIGAQSPSVASAIFSVVSLPLFAAVPSDGTTVWFWEVFLLNSLVWAAVAFLLHLLRR